MLRYTSTCEHAVARDEDAVRVSGFTGTVRQYEHAVRDEEAARVPGYTGSHWYSQTV